MFAHRVFLPVLRSRSRHPQHFQHRAFFHTPSGSNSPQTSAKGWRKHLHAFRDRPASHITAFAVLHEVTAVAPLIGVYYLLKYFGPNIPVPSKILEEGNRYINKIREYFGWPSLANDSPVLLHLATSYALVKAAAPLRIAVSVAMTPWVARWCVVPVARCFECLGNKIRRK
ncbi:hypothetical protein FB645_003129 [Coemansia sp. IMI 203386]|nr:hypothetical protein FB645_003129 [Coemansia sp. IMI 203386]